MKKQIRKDNNYPLISIIVPVYNVEKYIEKCITSLLNQSYTNIEILAVDDGSTDTTGRKLDEMAERDDRLKVIHKENGGVSTARNTGLDNFAGEYLAFVDSDDYVDTDYIKAMYERIEDGDLVVSGYNSVRNGEIYKSIILPQNAARGGTELGEYIDVLRHVDMGLLIIGSLCGKLYKCSIIRENNLRLPLDTFYAEDHVFNTKYMVYIQKVYLSNKSLYNYNVDVEGSLTKNRTEKLDYYWSSFTKAHQNLVTAITQNSNRAEHEESLAYFFSLYFGATYFIGLKRDKKEIYDWLQSIKDNKEYIKWLNMVKKRNAGIRTDLAFELEKLGLNKGLFNISYYLVKLMYSI